MSIEGSYRIELSPNRTHITIIKPVVCYSCGDKVIIDDCIERSCDNDDEDLRYCCYDCGLRCSSCGFECCSDCNFFAKYRYISNYDLEEKVIPIYCNRCSYKYND